MLEDLIKPFQIKITLVSKTASQPKFKMDVPLLNSVLKTIKMSHLAT